jgi:hypothetical protein
MKKGDPAGISLSGREQKSAVPHSQEGEKP